MTSRHWLRNLFGWASRSPATTRKPPPLRRRPLLEVLEDRLTPSTFTVNTLADTVDGNAAVTSLREAIMDANAHPGGDIINVSVSGTIDLTGELPRLTSNINIQGPGASSLTVRGGIGGDYYIFTVDPVTVGLAGLTIANGNRGGIYSIGNLTLINSTVSGNSTSGTSGPTYYNSEAMGGGIFSGGTLTLINSTVSGNSARGGNGAYYGGTDAKGGGIFSVGNPGGLVDGTVSSGALTLINSTVSGNSASGGNGGSYGNGNGQGGGIWGGGTMTFVNSTISGNSARGGVGGAGGAGLAGGIFNIEGTVTLINSTVGGNSASGEGAGQGGGIISTGTVTLTNSTLSGNSASGGNAGDSVGGGIFSFGTLTLTNSTLSGNSASGYDARGGGIWSSGIMTLANSALSGNTASAPSFPSFNGGIGGSAHGGGIYSSGTLTVINSTLSGNSASGSNAVQHGGDGEGGGIYSIGTLTVTNSTLSGNSAGGGANLFQENSMDPTGAGVGGAIFNTGALTVTNSTLSGNSASGGGGAGYGGDGVGGGIYNNGTLTLTNSTLSGNSASRGLGQNAPGAGVGGGIYSSGTLAVTNSTFSGNSATVGGGVLLFGAANIANTIIAGNSAASGPDVFGTVNSQGHNLIGKSDDSTGWTGSDLTGTNAIPLDAMLGPLQGNGGPTQTMALLAGSPAIDNGSNSLIPAGVTTDQRGPGFARIFGGTVDIGAFEAQPVNHNDSDADGIADSVDTLPATFSNDFSDGTTTGTIVSRGDQFLTIVDAPNLVDGVMITAGPTGGALPATISLANGASTLSLQAGDQVIVTHGSVIIHVVAGTVEATFVADTGETASASLDAGLGLTFKPDTFTFTAAPSNGAAVVQVTFVADSGQEATAGLTSGNTVAFQPDTGTFVAPATNSGAIVVVSNGTVVAVSPGATVDAVNSNPVCRADIAATNATGHATVNVLANDTDIDGDALRVSAVTQPSHGTVVINLDNTVSYTAVPGYVGSDSFTYIVSDGHGGTASGTVTLAVLSTGASLTPDNCNSTKTALVIAGTSGNDTIVVSPVGNSGTVQVTINGTSQGSFTPTGRIVVHGLGGNDNIQIAGSISNSAWLYGDDGDDRLKGGAGCDVLLGGSGDDLLVGGSGRDLLIGGAGADRLVGDAQDDILIAGCTDHDNYEMALCKIMEEWCRADANDQAAFQTRVNHLKFGGGLNDGFLLNDTTVHDDGVQDVLTGSSGNDWFLFNSSGDRATDMSTFEQLFAQDIDFINSCQ